MLWRGGTDGNTMIWTRDEIVKALRRLHKSKADMSYNALAAKRQPLVSAAALVARGLDAEDEGFVSHGSSFLGEGSAKWAGRPVS
jgi:hypothetical protein